MNKIMQLELYVVYNLFLIYSLHLFMNRTDIV